MSAQYLLPCPECENKVPVSARQAGAHVTCSQCNAQIDVPTLGQLKRYEQSEQENEIVSTVHQTEQNRLKGLLFSGGLILAVLAGAAAGGIYSMGMKKTVNVDVESEIEKSLKEYDEAPVASLYDAWLTRETDLGAWQEMEFKRINKEGGVLRIFSYVLMGLGAIGLIMLGCSFLVSPQSHPS